MLSFVTPGLIDLEGVFTFGVHAKEHDNPIGYFGTGLKYAIATLLRIGHKIHIHRGSDCHQVRSTPLNFRGKSFDKVYLDDRDLGFTTDLGKNWEVWMAFRELESNTRDERGLTTTKPEAVTAFLNGLNEATTIVVEGDAIGFAYLEKLRGEPI